MSKKSDRQIQWAVDYFLRLVVDSEDKANFQKKTREGWLEVFRNDGQEQFNLNYEGSRIKLGVTETEMLFAFRKVFGVDPRKLFDTKENANEKTATT